MALTAVCVRCGKSAEYEESGRGRYRPCPTCKAMVLVPNVDPRPPGPEVVEATCFCGASQTSPDEGLWYEVLCKRRHVVSEGGGLGAAGFIASLLLGPIGHLIQAFASREEAITVRVREVGWACPSCAPSLERARRLRVPIAIFTCSVFMALPWGLLVWLLLGDQEREIGYRLPWLPPLLFVSSLVGPLLAYLTYQLGRVGLAWRFSRVHRGCVRISWRIDLVSPVVRHPDGTYASAEPGPSAG